MDTEEQIEVSRLREQNHELWVLLDRLVVAGVNWDFGSDLKTDIETLRVRHKR